MRDQIDKAVEKVRGKRRPRSRRRRRLMKPLTAVEEEVYQMKNRSGQDPLNYPIKLNNKIAALTGVVEAPTTSRRPELRRVQGAVGEARRATGGYAEDAQAPSCHA